MKKEGSYGSAMGILFIVTLWTGKSGGMRGIFVILMAFAWLVSLLCSGTMLASGVYQVSDIGGPYVYANGLNEINQVVGYVKPDSSWSLAYAFSWSADTGLTSLGGYRASAINDLGQIAGSRGSYRRLQPAVWDNGHWVALVGRQDAEAINNHGQVVGLISAQPYIPGPYAPYRDDDIYSPGFVELVRPYPWASHGFDINNKGQVVADCGKGGSYVGVFYDSDGSYTILRGGGNGRPRSINDNGQIVGNTWNSSRHYAVFWNSPTSDREYMGELGSGNTVAYAINNSGQAVGYSAERAFLWTKDGGMLDLNNFIEGDLDITLTNATDISNNGSIVAWGLDSLGQEHSYLLTIREPRSVIDLEIRGPEKVKPECAIRYNAVAHYDNDTAELVTNSTQWTVEPESAASINDGVLWVEQVDSPLDIVLKGKYSENDVTVQTIVMLEVQPPYTLHVPSDYDTIQAAIDAAGCHDTVIVGDGLYTGDGNRDISFKGKSITVKSRNGPKNCIIDCAGTEENPHHGFYFTSSEDANSVLEGFTIKNGFATNGGGIYCCYSSPTIRNCIITNNSAGTNGGGLNNDNSSPSIIKCIFSQNSALGNDGGGINNIDNSSPTITDCIFRGNSSYDWGGAIRNIQYASPTITNCIFSGNMAGGDGGAVFNFAFCRPKILNCTFSGNTAPSGNAIACDSSYDRPSTIQVTNCILWDGGNEIYKNDDSEIALTYSDIQGGWPGEGNIDADPCFADAYGADYHLLAGSPCIDAGDPNYLAGPNETDLDGKPRVMGGRVDMGAYEFTIFNTEPVACVVGGDEVVEAGIGCEGRVVLDGSCSSDADSTAGTNDDINDFDWYEVIDVCDANSDVFLGSGEVIECNLGLGEHLIILEVMDKAGAFDSNEVIITVEDVTPPEFSLIVEPNVLWPPNNKMVLVTPGWEVSDNCDEEVEVSLVDITMSAEGDVNDYVQIGGDGSISLRAKKGRGGDMRVYTIMYEAVDDSGNAAIDSATVVVPHDRR